MSEDPASAGLRDLAGRLQGAVESASAAAVEKVTRPILVVVRWTILGAVFLTLVAFAIAAVVIGLVRLFDADVFKGRVWATDLVVAGIFCAAGALLWVLSATKKRGESAD